MTVCLLVRKAGFSRLTVLYGAAYTSRDPQHNILLAFYARKAKQIRTSPNVSVSTDTLSTLPLAYDNCTEPQKQPRD